MRSSDAKLKVVWIAAEQKFFAAHPNTNVTGHGHTPGAAIRDWQYWWNIPY